MVKSMTIKQPASWKHLARKPGSNYQQLFIAGRNIAARTLYGLTFPADDWPGSTPHDLATDFDLPLEAVEEAIAYCQSNPPEILSDWEMEEAVMKATETNQKSGRTCTLSPGEREEIARRFRP
jgi:hypothetical protein